MYTTVDGKTRLYITIPSNAPTYARTLELIFYITNGSVTVDFGDGSEAVTVTSSSVTLTHDYTNTGDYVITLTVNSGTLQFNAKIFNDSNANANRRAWLTHAEIGNNVTSIVVNTFYNCYSLQSVTIPNNVTSIGVDAFYNCYSLQSITIPSSVTSIGNSAFYNCYSLQNVTIPNNVTSIENSAFLDCYALQSVTIPSNVISIGANTFCNCYSLQSVTIPNNVTSIENSAFLGCYALQSVTIPSNVTSIGSYAFYSCYALQSVTIPSNVTSIVVNTFYNCYSLQSVTIPNNVTSIGNLAFNNCYALRAIHFKATTPPAVANSNAWSQLQTSCKIFIPFSASINYLTATNYPSTSTYTYIGYATYADGAALPTQDSSQRCNVRWYSTVMDAINQTNQITVGNGNEIYCRYV